jgi:hypothetical protein
MRNSSPLLFLTEHRGRVVSIPASYSGGPGFKSRPEDRLSWLTFAWFSSIRSGEYRGSTLKLGHDRFLPNHFRFIMIYL